MGAIEAAARAIWARRNPNRKEAFPRAGVLREVIFADAHAAIAAYRDAEIERLTAENLKLLNSMDAIVHALEIEDYDIPPEEEIMHLRAKLEAAELDAERYREWRRAFREGECGLWNALCEANSEAEHDAAIDSARGGEHG